MQSEHKTVQRLYESLATPILAFTGTFEIITCNKSAQILFALSENRPGLLRFSDLAFELLDEDYGSLTEDGFREKCLYEHHPQGLGFIYGIRSFSGGTLRWLRALPKIERAAGGAIEQIVLSLVEITDLVGNRNTNKQIFQAKSEWETTVDALQDIVTIQDKEMNIVRANKMAHEMFGFQLGELKGRKCYDVFFGQKKPCPKCPVSQTALDCCPHTGTMYNKTVNRTFSVSSFPIFNQGGEMTQLVHVARDITQYLQNESEKNRLMAAIEQGSESVVITDVNGEVQYVNPAFEKATGYDKIEAIGQRLNILKSGTHDDVFYKQMWETLLSKKVWRGRITNRRKNGTLFREDATISSVLDSSGNIINYVALKRDVTREELLEQQLHQAMKMEALGKLAGGVAHDFNNILASIIGYGEIAKGKLSPEHPVVADLDQVLASGDRAVDLVKQILTFSRRENYGRMQPCKVQHVVTEVINLLRPTLPPTIELKHEVEQRCCSVMADSSQIFQLLMNLCTNARQAIGEKHGAITISLREITAGGTLNMSEKVQPRESYLELVVSDTGCGIGKDKLEKIFDPFFTTKKKGKGTGLGLAVVHGIVKKHKGEIHVTSSDGEGTKFHVYLAIDGRDVENTENNVAVEIAASERVMVIDDEVEVGEMLKILLQDVGYRVTTYSDSMAAVRYFREDPDCCDIVLTDMLMPNMTGAELAREFLSIRRDLPIIMLTGHGENFDSNKALRLGIREFVLKPIRKDKLYQIFRKVLQDG